MFIQTSGNQLPSRYSLPPPPPTVTQPSSQVRERGRGRGRGRGYVYGHGRQPLSRQNNHFRLDQPQTQQSYPGNNPRKSDES